MQEQEILSDDFWPGDRIEHLSFDLSDTQPIQGFNHRWLDKKTFWSDMHYSVELGIVLSGKINRYYRGFHIDLVPGNIWLCNMWEPHGFKIIEAPCEIVFFMIFPPMLAKMCFEESNHINWLAPFYVPPSSRPQITKPQIKNRILSIGEDLKEILGCSEKISPLWLRLKLLQVLLIINDQWKGVPKSNNLSTDSFERISKAITIVFESKNKVTTQFAASQCSMNRNAFSSLFSRIMGIRYSEFGLLYRISAVAEQLRKTSIPIKAIATQWGFTDTAHMHHCFRKYYGCSLSDYRKRFPQSARM